MKTVQSQKSEIIKKQYPMETVFYLPIQRNLLPIYLDVQADLLFITIRSDHAV